MRFQNFIKCKEQNCGKKMKSARLYKGKFICYDCYASKVKILRLAPLFSNHPIKKDLVVHVSLSVPNYKRLLIRLKSLFPDEKGKKTGLGKYLRELILNDLGER